MKVSGDIQLKGILKTFQIALISTVCKLTKALILYHLACVTVRMDDQFDTDPVASVDFIRISHSRTHLRGPNASRASVKASKLFHRGFASMRYGMTSVVKYHFRVGIQN